MALQKTRVIVDNNGGKAQSVFEHNVVKIGTPVLGVLLLSIVGWLFQTVLALEENLQQNNIHIQHLHMAEEEFGKTLSKMQDTITDIRIQVGRFTAH